MSVVDSDEADGGARRRRQPQDRRDRRVRRASGATRQLRTARATIRLNTKANSPSYGCHGATTVLCNEASNTIKKVKLTACVLCLSSFGRRSVWLYLVCLNEISNGTTALARCQLINKGVEAHSADGIHLGFS